VFNLIFNGTIDKYPALNVIIGEVGVDWIPKGAWAGDEYIIRTPRRLGMQKKG